MALTTDLRAFLQGSCVLLAVVILFARVALANPRSCEAIRKDVEFRGFPGQQVLDMPQNGYVCGEGSCCNENLEKDFLTYTQTSIEKFLKDAVLKVATLVETRAKKFDDIFREMLTRSKQEFHDMFNKTYGKIYLQNAKVFSDFFDELENYYKKGTVRLSETMDTFFGILYQRMYMVINAQYNLDDKYMACVNDHMIEMKPFGDVPHKLTQQLKRSFIATRMFYKALARAAETVRETTSIRLDESCARELTRMQMCGVCRGEQGAGSCSRYCADTLSLCLRNHIKLTDSWDRFVDSVDKIADRLLGPYNVEAVVQPLNIKISEAIMNFQDIGKDVSAKIQSKCGAVELKRMTRNAGYPPEDNPNMEIRYKTMKIGKNKKNKKFQEKVDLTPTLDKLIEEIKLKVKNTKHFWLQLPYQYCNNETISASPSDDGNCWNGTMVGTYDQPKPKLEPSEATVVNSHIFVLDGLKDKLEKAFHGQDVDFMDDTEESFDGSGSGSGDGDEEEDEVHEDVRIVEEEVTPPPVSSTTKPEVVRTSSANSMSLTRALVSYLLPMVMVWFGGAIKDLL